MVPNSNFMTIGLGSYTQHIYPSQVVILTPMFSSLDMLILSTPERWRIEWTLLKSRCELWHCIVAPRCASHWANMRLHIFIGISYNRWSFKNTTMLPTLPKILRDLRILRQAPEIFSRICSRKKNFNLSLLHSFQNYLCVIINFNENMKMYLLIMEIMKITKRS